MKELIERLRTESPVFFKRLQWIIGVLAGSLGVLQILLSNGLFPWLLPYESVITSVITALAGAFGVSLLPKKDPQAFDGPGGTVPPPVKNPPPGKNE
ncbi:hypothetical protein [Chitinophaga nivalis]|uniref:Holin n=1 Tax=Chitinophaga nivalis TaxID=2991709 RepID=A0ABT3IJ94_9BACT|nr:hypothetical protein [Chitinophaga nivalis]MCW3466490.1 hypothetical protein [Chitinophaga nivalis]MCW3483819.1 hypothetical protein [Chitinophaga nivalis]